MPPVTITTEGELADAALLWTQTRLSRVCRVRCDPQGNRLERNTEHGVGKSRLTTFVRQVTKVCVRQVILVVLLINYCIIFHTNNCKRTFAPPCMQNMKRERHQNDTLKKTQKDMRHISKQNKTALAGGAQWPERRPVNRRVTCSFPLGAQAWAAGQASSRGRVRGNHTLMFLSSLSPSIPFSLKINKIFKKSIK